MRWEGCGVCVCGGGGEGNEGEWAEWEWCVYAVRGGGGEGGARAV